MTQYNRSSNMNEYAFKLEYGNIILNVYSAVILFLSMPGKTIYMASAINHNLLILNPFI